MVKTIKSILNTSQKIIWAEFTLRVTKDAKQALMTMNITNSSLKRKLKPNHNLLTVVPKAKLYLSSLLQPHSNKDNVNRKKRCKWDIKWMKCRMLVIHRPSTMRSRVTSVNYLKTMTSHWVPQEVWTVKTQLQPSEKARIVRLQSDQDRKRSKSRSNIKYIWTVW